MFNFIRNWIRELVVDVAISNLVVGGNCGLCGKWINNVIVPSYWRYSICKECSNLGEGHSTELKYPKSSKK